jgi:hypothetical protein
MNILSRGERFHVSTHNECYRFCGGVILLAVLLLQAKIAFLQGERRGHENLMKDLVRRIKMLEYALKQERSALSPLPPPSPPPLHYVQRALCGM